MEFWYARELMIILEYKQWRRFESVIDKTKQSCEDSEISVFEHFNFSRLLIFQCTIKYIYCISSFYVNVNKIQKIN